ncbi:MAG: glycosyltransferase [Candidatus Cloacimonetes bacterium]|nr:glycosyltransferase [Candidatus Cloacimonadota bacterium]MDY0337889.1 glycosyltransferase [Candidatus Cloacimonadaceae bacterium]MCK9334042.1 glycosyltransferase [Candidatus Cloacimonadota bacterium]MDD2683962.1 glycosyltransferase [Candidatus Cloacimonadota bacterium]MDD3096694.1 glycosyltransferase [Candidatus Cloacimonadota bacterium]
MKRSVAPESTINHNPEPISVIIAAKNEAQNLPALLSSIAQLEIPEVPYEIIIVSDHSSDETQSVIQNWDGQFGIHFIDFQDQIPGLTGKKAALQKGIDAAKYDVLAFTDADCQLPPNWLIEIKRSMSEEIDYMLGYSTIYRSVGDSDLKLVNFERSIYYALAAAGLAHQKAITASACNHVYRKSLFQRAGGFAGIGHILSGDDDLLLFKMMPYIKKAIYNPSVDMQVSVFEDSDLSRQYHKNIRRASKYKFFPAYLKRIAAAVFIYFILYYLALILLFSTKLSYLLLLSILIKSGTELFISQRHLSLVKKTHLGILYFPQILIFPLQFIFYAVRGSLGKYRWK